MYSTKTFTIRGIIHLIRIHKNWLKFWIANAMDTSPYEDRVKVLFRVMAVLTVVVILFGSYLCGKACSVMSSSHKAEKDSASELQPTNLYNPRA